MSTSAVDEADALERMLAGLELTAAASARLCLGRDERHTAFLEGMTLVVVLSGEIRHPGTTTSLACVTRPSDTDRPSEVLRTGDALLAYEDGALHLDALDGAEFVVSRLRPSEASRRHAALLPSMLAVTGFRERAPAAAELARHLGAQPDRSRPGNPVVCLLMHRMLLLELIRVWVELGCAPRGWPASARDPHLDRVVAAVEADPGRAWTVDALARIGAMSRSAFAAAFRRRFGVSPARFVTQTRMASAVRMLDAGASVTEAAAVLGYASTEGFSRRFRDHVGVTPSTWTMLPRVDVRG